MEEFGSKERKDRIQQLIEINRLKKVKPYSLLFEECLEVLKQDVVILSDSESSEIYRRLQSDFPFESWGRIAWSKVKNKVQFNEISDILSFFKSKIGITDSKVYILWGYGDDPVIQTNLKDAINSISHINAVGGDQWVYSPENKYVIEFYHEGEIVAAILE
ncbi:CDI toxin immunity protein [Acetivibrio cellulolyticus]|uniref:CDI toxin immunity protein n=1 Tax=Acetivibrio cellulolyticus TaxID=35830 RepID=UPI0001E2D54E|nr:hypothetical protein [Acetivibrio cellulolyticus]